MAEVAIVGGGPAGLSAALMLGRCRRQVVVCDDARPRNAASGAVHGFLSRDGISPAELLELSRAQAGAYPTVDLWIGRVVDGEPRDGGFVLALADGREVAARAVLIATGMQDELPPIPGLAALYGQAVFHCPYCDGYEVRDRPLAVLGRGDSSGAEFALELLTWSDDLVLFTDGDRRVSAPYREALARHRIPVREERIARLVSEAGRLVGVELATGEVVARRALFFNTAARPSSDLAARLGCELDHKRGVSCAGDCFTSVPGVFVAGDASRDLLQVAVAVGEGARAAVAIDRMLWRRDRLPPGRAQP
jgi:thioredoxin reductase